MIFAEMKYDGDYESRHLELLAFLRQRFSNVESGLQGDSYLWVLDGAEKVALDTFTSMKHQVKSPKSGQHVQQVIDVLKQRYKLNVYSTPELEGHEKE